jgi:hypothetical protein
MTPVTSRSTQTPIDGLPLLLERRVLPRAAPRIADEDLPHDFGGRQRFSGHALCGVESISTSHLRSGGGRTRQTRTAAFGGRPARLWNRRESDGLLPSLPWLSADHGYAEAVLQAAGDDELIAAFFFEPLLRAEETPLVLARPVADAGHLARAAAAHKLLASRAVDGPLVLSNVVY